MSHGSSGGDKCEPNLIPLLDLVLQLVMFFMVCANFVMEQVSEAIKLPEAVVAKPIEKADEFVIFLNVDKEGKVILAGLDALSDDAKDNTLTNPQQVMSYMKRRHDMDMKRKPKDGQAGPVPSLVIIRADKEAQFEKVYGVMKACRSAGYDRSQLRAIRFGGNTAQ
ncbi:ExbD/TolR family protein [Urbifossiella limnaea]|uniref:Colicin uptake protein TolR n=1 Tax=Urbifossiella limnaea TaxID=2528023 RepID=A0A517XZ90_9BACT|nr:biopolymer transporter ExbD [Urbifossiella limnaea]QDU22821.1 colicin uptake protein TolR [Urbifossiella limnaea]